MGKRLAFTACALAASSLALAALPPPDEAAKAKAAEAAAKSAWQAKVAAFKLCQVQDRIAASYRAKYPAIAAQPAAPAGVPMTPSNSGNPTTTAQGGGTPVAAAAPTVPACSEPGPPPGEKPLETSGAHSPAATAATPPSVRAHAAEIKPSKPGTAKKP